MNSNEKLDQNGRPVSQDSTTKRGGINEQTAPKSDQKTDTRQPSY